MLIASRNIVDCLFQYNHLILAISPKFSKIEIKGVVTVKPNMSEKTLFKERYFIAIQHIPLSLVNKSICT